MHKNILEGMDKASSHKQETTGGKKPPIWNGQLGNGLKGC